MEKVEKSDTVNRDELIMQQQREIEKEVGLNSYFSECKHFTQIIATASSVYFYFNVFMYLSIDKWIDTIG